MGFQTSWNSCQFLDKNTIFIRKIKKELLWGASKNEGEIIITSWLESLFFEGSLLDKGVNTRIILRWVWRKQSIRNGRRRTMKKEKKSWGKWEMMSVQCALCICSNEGVKFQILKGS